LFGGGLFFTGAAFAAVDGVSTSPLKIYSVGIGGGGFYSLSDSLKEASGAFGKVVWMNSFDFTENFALFADINWYIGNSLNNFGLDLGGDYKFASVPRIIPFLGAGVGAHYFDKESGTGSGGGSASDEFSKAFGVSLTARVGVALELTETVDVRVRVPFHFVLNDTQDMGIGVEVGVMFYSSLRGVKKLNY